MTEARGHEQETEGVSGGELLQRLEELGLDVQKGISACGEQEFLRQLQAYLTGFGFLKLGQNVSRGQWQSAAMTVRSLDREAERLGIDCLGRWFTGLKAAVSRRDEREAKRLLTLVTQRRTRMRELIRTAKEG